MTSTLHHNPKHSRRVAELDVLRGLAITAVVGLHVTWAYLIQAPLDRPEGKAVAVLHLLTGFGVPLFLILSGTGLALRYSQAMKWRDYRGFLYRRALRLLPAYVTWSLVVAAHTDPALLWPPSRLVSLLLTGSAGPQFYFIPLLCSFYILWPLLRPLAVAAAASCRSAVAITAVATALSLAWWQASAAGLIVANTLTLTGFWLLYMVAGLALAPHLAGLGRARARHFALVG
ncbi:MAG: acyltransferase, partial [Deltaproteobacteria bacterium]